MMGGFQYMERQQTDMSLFWHSSRDIRGGSFQDLLIFFCMHLMLYSIVVYIIYIFYFIVISHKEGVFHVIKGSESRIHTIFSRLQTSTCVHIAVPVRRWITGHHSRLCIST